MWEGEGERLERTYLVAHSLSCCLLFVCCGDEREGGGRERKRERGGLAREERASYCVLEGSLRTDVWR